MSILQALYDFPMVSHQSFVLTLSDGNSMTGRQDAYCNFFLGFVTNIVLILHMEEFYMRRFKFMKAGIRFLIYFVSCFSFVPNHLSFKFIPTMATVICVSSKF